MSRKQVRDEVAKWLWEGNIPSLNQVLRTFPKRINFQVNATAGQQSRAAGVVFIESEGETRVSVGGPYAGWKRIDYEVVFQVFHHSTHRDAEKTMDDFDALLDGIQDRLRAGGHRLGDENGYIIWQAAEPQINVQYGEPMTNEGGATETWAAVRFTVTQFIQA